MTAEAWWVIGRGFIDACVPYGCAALGGLVSERSGVPNVALEASLLVGALGASVVVCAGGGVIAALVLAFVVGASVGAMHAVCTVIGRASSVVVGMALNLAALGATRGFLRIVYGSSANGPSFETRLGPLGAAAVLATAAVAIALVIERTRAGVALRAVGENHGLASSVGFPVGVVRAAALGAGHGLSALGGACLCLGAGQFQSQMSAGRGFLALALVILGRWEVVPTLVGAMALAALEAGEVFIQEAVGLPSEAVVALPFLAILPVLALGAGRMRGPRIPRFDR